MRSVILLGKGDLAIRIGDWFLDSPEWQLDRVVPVMPEPTWTGSISQWATRNGVEHVESGDYRDIPGVNIDGWSVDLAMSVFYDKLIPESFIRKCDRIINLHNGPLPRYRGVSPINWALKNGESMHGVTIHEIAPGIDDGPIVAQAWYSIYPEIDEVRDVYGRSLAFGWALFEQTIPMLDRIEPRAQDETAATYYSTGRNAELGNRRRFTRAES